MIVGLLLFTTGIHIFMAFLELDYFMGDTSCVEYLLLFEYCFSRKKVVWFEYKL